jgi:hypothetical protein
MSLSATVAQAAPDPTILPDGFVNSPTGVELRTGRYVEQNVDLSIGDPARGGIQLVRSTSLPKENLVGPGNGTENPLVNYEFYDTITQRESTANASGTIYIYIHINGIDKTFATDVTYSGFIDVSPSQTDKLQRVVVGSSHYYVMQSSDGSVVTFATTTATSSSAISKAMPDGVTYTYSSGRMVSNAGYALIHDSGGAKICVLNLAVTALPAGNTCPAGVPTTSYTYSGTSMTSFTDVRGNTWAMTNGFTAYGTPFQRSYFFPGATTPYLTNYYDFAVSIGTITILKKQVFADGRTYTYNYIEDEFGPDGSQNAIVYVSDYSDQLANKTSLTWQVYRGPFVHVLSPSPTGITDPLNRTSTYTFQSDGITIGTHSLPTGITATYSYDTWHNLTQTSIAPAPPSTLPAMVTSATYDCSTFVHCLSPTSKTDANGNTTNIAYDATTGLVVTSTGPAVGGIHPQVRYSYAQRYAWISNGAGGYMHAGPPIWVLTQQSICKTGAPATSGTGCALGSSDQVITSYEYGPDSGPNNLLLRGTVVDATGLALRTCYGYDYSGRKISETTPRAGLASCP